MNWTRLSLTAATIFVIGLVWNGLVHGLVLREANEALQGLARPLAQRPLALGLALTAGVAFLFAYSYAALVRMPGLKGALGHGVFFALLAGLLVDLNQYVLYPIPGSLAAAWFVFGLLEFCVYGVVACWLYPIPAAIGGMREPISTAPAVASGRCGSIGRSLAPHSETRAAGSGGPQPAHGDRPHAPGAEPGEALPGRPEGWQRERDAGLRD